MKLSEYQRSRSLFDLGQRSLRFQSKMFDFGLYTQVSDSGPHGPLVVVSSCFIDEPKQNQGRGLVDHKLVQASQ